MSKIKSNKLSFTMDEEEEEEPTFVVKKSSGATSDSSDGGQKFKKIRQAPLLVPVEEKPAPVASAYSSDNLKLLRESQKFAESQKFEESLPMEGVELSGEAAEQLEEKLNSSKPKVRFSFDEEPSKPVQEPESDTPDFIAFKTEKKETFDMNIDNDDDWESEMARRGSLNSSVKAPPSVMSKSFTIGENATKEEITVNTNKNKYSFGSGGASGGNSATDSSKYLTVEDASKMIQLAVGKLALQQEATDRQINQLEVEITETEKEYNAHKGSLEVELRKQNVIQDTQEFFRNLIGMLREKLPLIEDIKNRTYEVVRERQEALKRRRTEQQEDMLFRVKEAGELMTIGEYEPTAILSSGDVAAQAVAGATLKTREAAARLVRLQAIDAFNASVAGAVSAEDRQYFVANRIDKVSSSALQERLYELELSLTGNASDVAGIQIRLDALRLSAESIMFDVEPSVYDMSEAVRQLSAFRDTFPERYKSAYISPSLPEVLEPLLWYDVVSCTDTLLGGNGAGSPGDGFVVSERSWHEPLREFSAMSVGDEESAKRRATLANIVNEGDTNLLPKLVAAVLLPWLTDVIKVSLDPCNTSACSVCSDLISQLLDYDISDAQLAPLLDALLSVFNSELDSICIPVVKNPQINSADSESAESSGSSNNAGVGRSFALRQLHRLLTVLQNLLLFKDYLTPLVLMRVGWSNLTGKCLAALCKLLSASDFQNVEIIRRLCLTCCVLIEGDSAMDLNHTLQCGVKIPLFRELRATLNRIEAEKSDNQGIRVALLNILNKL